VNFSTSKLSFKGLFLVAILLLLELLFVGCYAWLLSRAEDESTKQQKAKAIISRTNLLLHSLYEAGTTVAKYTSSHDPTSLHNYEIARDNIPKDIAWLKEQLISDPNQLNLLKKIDDNCTVSLAVLDKMRHVSDTEPALVAMRYAIKIQAKMQARMEPLVHDFIDFLKTEKKIESEGPAAMKFQRDCLGRLLMGALAINIFAAVMLALFFVRSITSRLAVVVDNSDRLRQRSTLRSPLPGTDEIALLDRAFHEMSSSLRGEEDLIRANEEQIRAMIDQMPIGLMIIADEEKIEYANPMLEKLLDYENGALVGSRLSSHFSTSGAKGVPLTGTTAIQGVVELIAHKKDRRELFVEFAVVDVSLSTISRRLAIVVDVSERHEVEKMRQAFVAMVSHELRTPLTSVAGFLQLLPMGVYGQIESKAINEASRAEGQVDQLIMLINELLDLEKLEAGKLEMAKAKVSLEDVIDSALDSVCSLAEMMNVAVMFEGCEVDVVADRERLRQAISKMLTCMLRLCSEGETIDVVVDSMLSDEAVTICLNTRSLAIPREKLQFIFEPFQQVELPSLSRSLGLGLTLSRAIALQHGGSCGANPAANGGTSIWLQLPNLKNV
jgi:PAS domain S-box-containing protein